MIRVSSGRNGSDAASEPAAMMQCSKPTTVSPTLIVLGPVNSPVPRTTWTLRCLASDSRPPVSLPTTPSFHARTLSTSIVGFSNVMPASPSSSASVSTFATCSSALDGMQPTFRQTPPSCSPRSIRATREAEVGRAERRGVAARAAAEHGDLDLDVGVGERLRRPRRLRLGLLAGARSPAWTPRRLRALERQQHRALGDLVADRDRDVGDLARRGRRDLHRRLVGLEHDQRILDRDLVTDGDEHLDHGDRVEIPDVRDLDLHQSSTLRRSESWLTRCATKRAASAPSITRWS